VPVLKCKWKVRLAVQLADLLGETIFYIGFQRHMLRWRKLHSAHVACVQREANARPGGGDKEVHYNVLLKMRCRTVYRTVFWSVPHKTELLGVKVTIDFQRQCRKNLITVQSVNCSGRVATTNFVIPTIKFPLVVSRLQTHVSTQFFEHGIQKNFCYGVQKVRIIMTGNTILFNFFCTLKMSRQSGF
jgi:hypothetical protein